ncbi:hypothetical protein ACGF0J_21875 [Nonomuraea sp. NPDC047897]|uniref:hypothetical protein n=1 Tax=Nonomuraea sp. NPDC047897 TaxID=3364346 RepID=UPI00371724BB
MPDRDDYLQHAYPVLLTYTQQVALAVGIARLQRLVPCPGAGARHSSGLPTRDANRVRPAPARPGPEDPMKTTITYDTADAKRGMTLRKPRDFVKTDAS